MNPGPTSIVVAGGREGSVSPIELFVLLGAVAWILLQSSWAPQERRRDRTWSTLVAWSITVAVVLFGRILQWTSSSDAVFALGLRLQVFSAPVVIVVVIVVHARLADPARRVAYGHGREDA